MNSTMRARISEGISSAMKMRMSDQLAANHVQRLLRGPLPDAGAVAEELSFDHGGLAAVSHRRVDQAHRLLFRPAAGPGDARDANSQRSLGALADSFSQRHGHLAADRSVFLDDRRLDAGHGYFES